MTRRLTLAALAAALLPALSPAQPAPDGPDKTVDAADQFRKVSAAYNQAYQKLRRPPQANDLKPFLQQVGNADALLVSPRDSKPLVIVSFAPDAERAEDERSIVAYEQVGMDGKRMTVDIRGTVVLEKDADFANLKFAGGHTPAGR